MPGGLDVVWPEELADLRPSDGGRAFMCALRVDLDTAAADDAGVWGVVDQVMGHAVLTALPEEDRRAVPDRAPDVVNVIVEDVIAPVHVLGAGPISTEDDAGAAEIFDVVADDTIALGVKIESQRGTLAVSEATSFDGASGGAAQAQCGGRPIVRLPVVLHARAGSAMPRVAVVALEGQSAESKIAHERVVGAAFVEPALHANQFGQQRCADIVARRVAFIGPEVNAAFVAIEHPLAGLVKHRKDVLDPG